MAQIPEATDVETSKRPLVATLAIDPAAQAYFNDLRQKHFPPERNYLDAHLTLFNALPDEPWIIGEMERFSAGQAVFEGNAQQIVSLGNGTAVKIVSAELAALHQQLRKRFFEALTNQGRQSRNFHITIQNKVAAGAAKALQAELAPDFVPFTFTASGIHLWRYLGGPWEFLQTFGFSCG